jgi:hypothetical protein
MSPDLNPIETLWNRMKDRLQDQHGHEQGFDKQQLKQWIMEAWDAIDEHVLRALITSMPARCQAVIDAQGGDTKY